MGNADDEQLPRKGCPFPHSTVPLAPPQPKNPSKCQEIQLHLIGPTNFYDMQFSFQCSNDARSISRPSVRCAVPSVPSPASTDGSGLSAPDAPRRSSRAEPCVGPEERRRSEATHAGFIVGSLVVEFCNTPTSLEWSNCLRPGKAAGLGFSNGVLDGFSALVCSTTCGMWDISMQPIGFGWLMHIHSYPSPSSWVPGGVVRETKRKIGSFPLALTLDSMLRDATVVVPVPKQPPCSGHRLAFQVKKPGGPWNRLPHEPMPRVLRQETLRRETPEPRAVGGGGGTGRSGRGLRFWGATLNP